MVEKRFTPEEMGILKSNPYTARASEKRSVLRGLSKNHSGMDTRRGAAQSSWFEKWGMIQTSWGAGA